MTLLNFKAGNHPQQTAIRGAVDAVDDRATHPSHFDLFNAEFGPFTIDVAAAEWNTKCDRYYDKATNGLAQSWAGERVWCNPPYSAIEPWIRKAWDEWAYGRPELIVMLLPANRTEQKWWQRLVEPQRDRDDSFRVRFLPGRMKFIKAGALDVGPNERPPFGCCLLIWRSVVTTG